jgi:hypothetical protein
LSKDPGDRYPDGRTFAEDAEDVLAGRTPRHREGWLAPERREGTWVSVTPLDEPGTVDLSPRPRTQPLRSTASLARPAPRSDEASLVMRISDRMGRRGFFALGALVAAGLVLALLLPPRTTLPEPTPSPGSASGSSSTFEPAPEATPTPSKSFLGGLFGKEPAHLDVEFEHSLRGGTLKLWVDDELVLEEKLQSAVVKKIGPLRIRKGLVKKLVDLSDGEHVIKVQVQGDGFFGASRIKGSFEKGETRRLEVNKGGLPLLKKELNLEWS